MACRPTFLFLITLIAGITASFSVTCVNSDPFAIATICARLSILCGLLLALAAGHFRDRARFAACRDGAPRKKERLS